MSEIPIAVDECLEGQLVPTNKLWMGDLEPYMDEVFLTSVFAQFGYHVQSIRWIRNYQTGLVARYCFVEFNDAIAARQALERLNGQFIPGTSTGRRFKLNWASRKIDSGQMEFNIFVADLSRDVTSQQLLEFFQQRYKSIRYAKVIEDEEGISKGYGFVRFTDESERDRSLTEMSGALGLSKKPLTIKPALAPKAKTPLMPVPDVPSVATGYGSLSPHQWSNSPDSAAAVSSAYTPPTGPSYIHPTSTGGHPYCHLSRPPYYSVPPSQPTHLYMTPSIHGYVEDLVDPNPPLDMQLCNKLILDREKEQYLLLENSRWQLAPDAKVL